MGIELELGVLLALTIIGSAGFAVFEIETPWWRKIAKWALVVGITLGLYRVVSHWAVLFPLGAGLAGVTFHVWWCRRHDIDPVRATPRGRYYQLRGWQPPEL